MRLRDKLGMLFTRNDIEYNSSVNKFIKRIIQDGEILNRNSDGIIVRLYDKKYIIQARGGYNHELSNCIDESGDYLYLRLRPSRLTQLRFWIWFENEYVVNRIEREKVKTEKTRIRRRITEILKEGGSEKNA